MRFRKMSLLMVVMFSLGIVLFDGMASNRKAIAEQENLIEDAGFENQTAASISHPWRIEGAGGVDRELGYSHSGLNNAWIYSKDGWTNIYQKVDVAKNTDYIFSGWVKSINQSNGYFGARAKRADGSIVILSETVFHDETPAGQPDEYKLLSVTVNSGDYDSLELYAGFWGNGNDAWVQVDDFSLVKEIKPSTTDSSKFVLNGVKNLTKVAQLTGKNSINKTDKYDLYGTDLGSMIEMNGKVYMTFGDTFGVRPDDFIGGGGSNWRSSTMAVISDKNPSDGLTFDGFITGPDGNAKELLSSKKINYDEMTVIPTGGFSIGNRLYLNFMSVHHWGDPGRWTTNYSGLACSDDGGNTWTKLDDVKWPGGSNFIQVTTAKKGNDIYFWSIPQGRFGGVKLMKSSISSVEDISKYQYFAGTDKDGEPLWSSNMPDAREIIEGPVGELSVIWNKYLGRWIMTYLNEKTASIEMREGITPWGEWSEPVTVAKGTDYPGLYGAFMTPKYVEDNGRVIYFTMSQWDPYNVFLMKVELDRSGKKNSYKIEKMEDEENAEGHSEDNIARAN